MTQDPLTLYKLIVLYMLNRVSFPLTKSQICDFILGKEYTSEAGSTNKEKVEIQ